MDKRLVNTLLNVLHSPDSLFRHSKALAAFCEEYNLGRRQGASLAFTERDKAEIGRILRGEAGIDPATATPASWDRLDRAQSLGLGHDEKLSGRPVSAGRLRLKTLPGQALDVAGGNWTLPPRIDLGVDLDAVLGSRIGHDVLLVVENLQTFDEIHAVRADVMAPLAGRRPLVTYRGDAQGGARADAVHALIERTELSVYAFVDFDAAGLVIASTLPRLDQVLAPALPDLEEAIRANGIVQRHLDQVAAAGRTISDLTGDPRIAPLWDVISRVGKALPQEHFHKR